MEHLIIKYLNKEASEEEIAELHIWRNKNPENEKTFHELQQLWKITSTENIGHIDTNKAWALVSGNLKPQAISIPIWQKPWMKVAACILIVLGVTFFARKIFDPCQHIDSLENTTTIILPDNSKITLNRNTHLDYRKDFKTNRQIRLSGEAFFWVTKDKTHPFIVETSNGKIQVVGTSFNIDCDNLKTTVSVQTGKVLLSNLQKEKLLLPGQQGIISKNSDSIVLTSETQQPYDYYITHFIKCNNTSLANLAVILEKAFDIKVVFQNKSISEQTITAEFPDNDLELIIQILEKTLDLKITLQKNKLLFKNK